MRQQLNKLKKLLVTPEYLALLLILVFGGISAFIVPQMTVSDEGMHLLKSYALSEGKLSGRTCVLPQSIFNEAKSSPESTPTSSSQPINYQDTSTASCGSAAGYSPTMHLPQTIGIIAAKALNGSPDLLVLFGRLANVVFYAVAIFLIIRFVMIGKWVYFVVAVFPVMIHIAGSLSADTVNNVIVMATLAYIINLFVQSKKISKSQFTVLIALSIMLALTKQTNLILLLPLAALPATLFNKNSTNFKLSFNLQKWLIIGITLTTGAATVLIANKLLGSMLFHQDSPENPLLSDPFRFFLISYNTYINPALGYGDLLVRGIVGEFSAFKYHLPTFLVFGQFIALLIALFYPTAKEHRVKLHSAGLFASLSASSLVVFTAAITLALYSAWAILPVRLGTGAFYADGVQGRYFTAALVALVPIAVYLRRWIKIEAKPAAIPLYIISFISVSSLLFYVAQTINTFYT